MKHARLVSLVGLSSIAGQLLGAVGCAAAPTTLPTGTADASPSASAPGAQAPGRVSHREELLREATTTGLDVVFEGWLDAPSASAPGSIAKDLGSASADTCVRIRVAAPPSASDAGATPSALTLTEHEGDRTRATAFSVHDGWLAPYCVRRGARLVVATGAPVELVVVASAAFR